MRPEKLVLEAFGPFAEPQTIDFRELGKRNFFLIHGPTGAGKTSILDAMCFALFGETSGNERTARQARSDHAAPSATTRVTLDFALGGERYRVEREPEYEREKRRGSGTTLQPARATLWRLEGGGEDLAPGMPLASGVKPVGEEIERLLQFGADQFRQVVVLPQGQFRRLLTATSKDREDILATLFGTALYRRIEDVLREARLGLERERRDLTKARETMLDRTGVETLADLEARRVQLAREIEELEAKRGVLGAAAEQAGSLLHAAEKIADILRERDDAQRELAQLEAATRSIAAQRRELDRARRAEKLAHARKARAERRSEAESAAVEVESARRALRGAEAALAEATVALERERARDGQREAVRANAAYLTELRQTRAPRLARAHETHASAAAELEKARRQLDADAKRYTELVGERDEVARQRDAARALAARREARAAIVRERQGRVRRLGELARARSELTTLGGAHAAREREKKHADDARAAAQRALDEMRATRDAAGAAILAQRLVAGTPCPVCGSTAHPNPAQGGESAPSDVELEQQSESVTARERELADAAKAQREASRLAAEAGARVKTLEEGLGPTSEAEGELAAEELDRAQRELAEAEHSAQIESELEARLYKLDAEIDPAREQCEAQRECVRRAERAESASAADLAAAAQEVPLELRDPEALHAESRRVEAELVGLQRALDRAESGATAAASGLDVARESLANAETAANRAGERDRSEGERLAAALAFEGFGSEVDLDAAARLPEQIDALERGVREHDERLAAAADRERRARADAVGQEPPDLDVLRGRGSAASQAFLAAVESARDRKSHLEATDKDLGHLRRNCAALADLDARYAVVGRVAEISAGDNRLRLPFHRFVLAAQLDLVLDAATHRLRAMSDGRYALARAAEPGSRRGTAGLELEVFDAYTGIARAAATLSGGEGFLASLSLALGLADVVQANAGGIHLDSIFVDEGFGSLDPEALDLALRSLLDLRSARRMVGIISHVPELKEQVATRLEVTAGRSGSRAKFHLG